MPRRYSNERTTVLSLRYHFIWSPNYRKKALTDKVAFRLESLMEEKVDEQNLEIIELSIRPDLVKLFISGHPKLAPNKNIQQIEGDSSRVLWAVYDFSLPSLWTRSCTVSTAGEVSSQVIKEYIEPQTGQ